jgi:hypothetical protein
MSNRTSRAVGPSLVVDGAHDGGQDFGLGTDLVAHLRKGKLGGIGDVEQGHLVPAVGRGAIEGGGLDASLGRELVEHGVAPFLPAICWAAATLGQLGCASEA